MPKNDFHFEILNLTDELLGFRSRLNNLLKSAFFNLSSAKYQIGAENVTALQYDKRMKSDWNFKYSIDDEGITGTYKKTTDPVEWFGFLAPKSLRNAQEEFISAVDVLVEIAILNNLIKKTEAKLLSSKLSLI